MDVDEKPLEICENGLKLQENDKPADGETTKEDKTTKTESLGEKLNGDPSNNEICNKNSPEMVQKKRRISDEKPYPCVWAGCTKSFATGYALKSHYRVHTGEKPYVCKHCTKAFKTSGDLQKHIRTHTGEKPFKCPFENCGKKFTTSHICKVHIRTHTGERPYKCPFPECAKAFATVTNYKNHVRIHTGEKPYACEVENCGKRFTEYSSYYKHQTVHTDRVPYKCLYCGRAYRHAHSLADHKRTVHNDTNKLTDSERQFLLKKSKMSAMNGVTELNEPSTSKTTLSELQHNAIFGRRDLVLIPMDSQTSDIPTQQVTLMATPSGPRLAIISADGTTQQFALSLADQSTNDLINENDESRKNDSISEMVFVTDESQRQKEATERMLEMSEPDNADSSNIEDTPINTDIWLHQPQSEEKNNTVNKGDNSFEKVTAKNEPGGATSGYVVEVNDLEEMRMSNPVAFFEIAGSKYQVKIVNDGQEGSNELGNDPGAYFEIGGSKCQVKIVNEDEHDLTNIKTEMSNDSEVIKLQTDSYFKDNTTKSASDDNNRSQTVIVTMQKDNEK